MGTRLARYLRGVWILAVASCVSACDEAIHPFESTAMVYSVFGFLDVHADTQWVRVAPFRESIFTTPDPVDAAVTVENLGTGQVIELIPVLFRRVSANFGDSLFAYNFQTTEPLEYSATYQLTARHSDGSIASSVVRIPPDHSHLPSIVARRQPSATPGSVDHIRFHLLPDTYVGMVLTRRYSSTDPLCRNVYYNPLPRPLPVESGGEIKVNIAGVGPGAPCSTDIDDIGIVRSWEPWPYSGINDYTNAFSHTNIENGVGYLAGLAVTSVPFEKCDLVGPGAPMFCELYYAPDTATLLVRPVNISGFPEEYPVEQGAYPFGSNGELARGEESWARLPSSVIRTSDSRAPRVFRFPGLYPGRYHIYVEGEVGPFPMYCEERTVDLGPGETTIDILMTLPELLPGEPVNANGCREG